MSKIHPVILSGGAGTRLWPASRAGYPKQLLPLIGDRTMLQETALRLKGLANQADSTLVICNEAHRFLVAEQMREIDRKSTIVLEPEGRNTAPAVALAALLLQAKAKEGESPLLLIMPADHAIEDVRTFQKAVGLGTEAAEEGNLVTFGIVPTRAETGYGYIEADANEEHAVSIHSFVEKPDQATANKLFAGRRHFWNSGMFLFRADAYIDALEKYAPDILAACERSIKAATADTDFVRPDAAAFKACRKDSIDYAVMEKAANTVMVPLDAGWSDVGSWAALHDVSSQDENGNVLQGDVEVFDCKDTFIRSESRLVGAVGLDNVVVVETKDAVLVVTKERSQDVKHIVDALEKNQREESKLHRQVFRPWGSYDSIDAGDGFQVKRLIVNPGAILSLQKHHRRAEHWVVVRGVARITLDDEVFDLGVNESTYIPIEAKHRIANPGDEPLHIIEVQCGDYLGEDDIVRFEDNYGREGTNT